MKTYSLFRYLMITAFSMVAVLASLAQAPSVAYPSSMFTFPLGNPISPIVLTNTGGPVSEINYGQVTTLAGSASNTPGSADGTGTFASFNTPMGVVVDAAGNAYIADSYNNKIRKVSPTGDVTTFAGDGSIGSVDAAGTLASFYYPCGLAIDASGYIYVADFNNNKIRKISPLGVVSTLAVSGHPKNLALDASGNVYVAEGSIIRKISPLGAVTIFATSGVAPSGAFSAAAIAVDGTGNVYVGGDDYKISKITPLGVMTTLAGSGSWGYVNGTSGQARFKNITGMTIDAFGYLYVADVYNHSIRRVSPDGRVSSLAGTAVSGSGDGTGAAASFLYPSNVALSANGSLVVSEQGNNKVRKISLLGHTISPDLPTGLSFDVNNGTISGTPTAAFTISSYTVVSQNTAGGDTAKVNMIYEVGKVSSISPTTGLVGSSVTITGTYFNANPSSNIVFFGATKATVTAGTTTSLTVTVPVGASYAPITVLNSALGLSYTSSKNFLPVYSPHKNSITLTDFDTQMDIPTEIGPSFTAIGDMDGDGKPDLIVPVQSNTNFPAIWVYRNTGSVGNISFDAPLKVQCGNAPGKIVVGDLDGDGKLDMTVVNTGGAGNSSVFRNTSSIGSLSFASQQLVAFVPNDLQIGDIDGDGKPDFMGGGAVLRNTSSIGSISFASEQFVLPVPSGGIYGSVLGSGDMDGDGKIDLVVKQTAGLFLLRNTSIIGNISFAQDAMIGDTLSSPWLIDRNSTIADIDGDGKSEIITSFIDSIGVYRNTSSVGSISFAARTSFKRFSQGGQTGPLGDMDGDGKLDLLIGNGDYSTISVFRNTSTVGNISFANYFDLPLTGVQNGTQGLSIGDIDGDGKPELVGTNFHRSKAFVFRNISMGNAYLSSLVLSSGTLSPSFVKATTAYTAFVTHGILSITVTPTLEDVASTITVRVNGSAYNAVVNGTASAALPLNEGPNTIDVKVVGENGSTIKIYTIIVTRATSTPVTITNFKAFQKGSAIQVEWNTQNEINLHSYEVEKSTDGSSFSKAGTVTATGLSSYNWLDPNPKNGNNYYRLKMLDKDGSFKYSSIVNVKIGGIKNVFTIAGNPIRNGQLVLQMENVDKGSYAISIYNNLGQQMMNKTIVHEGGSATQTIALGNVPAGIYHVSIVGAGLLGISKTIVVE